MIQFAPVIRSKAKSSAAKPATTAAAKDATEEIMTAYKEMQNALDFRADQRRTTASKPSASTSGMGQVTADLREEYSAAKPTTTNASKRLTEEVTTTRLPKARRTNAEKLSNIGAKETQELSADAIVCMFSRFEAKLETAVYEDCCNILIYGNDASSKPKRKSFRSALGTYQNLLKAALHHVLENDGEFSESIRQKLIEEKALLCRKLLLRTNAEKPEKMVLDELQDILERLTYAVKDVVCWLHVLQSLSTQNKSAMNMVNIEIDMAWQYVCEMTHLAQKLQDGRGDGIE